jgi:flagellar basal body-associated protein FliL
MKIIIGLLIYALSVATIIAFMMGASRKDKEYRNES